jgi:inorganic pyrophosphatase
MKLKVLIEIPKNQTTKIEYEYESKELFFDRCLDLPMAENYGSILGSKIQEDGDEADCFILTERKLSPNLIIPTDKLVLIGRINFIDKSEKDLKNLFLIKEEYDRALLLASNADYSEIKKIIYRLKVILNFLQMYKKTFNLQKDRLTYIEKTTLTLEFKEAITNELIFDSIKNLNFESSDVIWSDILK